MPDATSIAPGQDDPAGTEPRELDEELLELVIGGAGDPPPALTERLRRAGALRPQMFLRPRKP